MYNKRNKMNKDLRAIALTIGCAAVAAISAILIFKRNKMKKKRIFEIWKEGYMCMGEHGHASFVAKVEATSFNEACEILSKTDKLIEFMPDRYRTGHERWCSWGCELFDSEKKARKQFG
jgi:hypothetical protein